jgi:hypothetical protein
VKINAPDLSTATKETAPLYAYIVILVQEANRMAAEIERLSEKLDGIVEYNNLYIIS